MTIGDYSDLLAAGMIKSSGEMRRELDTVVVRKACTTNFEAKPKKRCPPRGCANGTVFRDSMDEIEGVQLSKEARLKTFGSMPSEKDQYCAKPLSQGGSDQGCVFCKEDRPPISVEDGGRHNAVDKIALYGAE